MKKLYQFLLCFLPFFVAEGLKAITATVLSVIYIIFKTVLYLMGREEGIDSNVSQHTNELVKELSETGNTTYIISMLAILICGIVFFIWYRNISKTDHRICLKRHYSQYEILLLIILGVGSQLLVTGVLSIVQPFFQKAFDSYGGNMDQLLGASPILVILYVVLIAPVTEELIFRGVIMHKLSKQISFFGTNLIQALIFGIYHLNLIQGIYAFVLGLILGYVAQKYKSLVAAIILHSVINGLAFLVGIFKSSLTVHIAFLLIGVLVIGFCIDKIRKMQ